MIHYIIVAHKSPEYLNVLIDSLNGNDVNIIIHLDWYQDISDYQNLERENIFFVKNRVKVRRWWFSMVQWILNALNQINNKIHKDDHIIILSGQDYPLQNSFDLKHKLQSYIWKSFIEYRIQPNYDRNILNRVVRYHFHDLIVYDWLNTLVEKIVSLFVTIPHTRNQIFVYARQRVVNFFLPIKKYLTNHYSIYWWSSWMILSWKHALYINDFCSTKKWRKFIEEFKTIAWPDEIFFQTLLLSSEYADDIRNWLPWYIDWKKWPGLPRILDESDYQSIQKCDKRFARKFELHTSNMLIQDLKKII